MRVDYEVTPEPTGDEREALERVLPGLLEGESHAAYASAWRQAGVVENTGAVRLLGDGPLAE